MDQEIEIANDKKTYKNVEEPSNVELYKKYMKHVKIIYGFLIIIYIPIIYIFSKM